MEVGGIVEQELDIFWTFLGGHRVMVLRCKILFSLEAFELLKLDFVQKSIIAHYADR